MATGNGYRDIEKQTEVKRKVFLASATLMHTFRGGSKLKLKKLTTKDRMKRSKDKATAKREEREEGKVVEK